jgi:hypothetical protein
MRQSWWQMPGPSYFIKIIVDDLIDGKNVCMLLPSIIPRGLKTAVKDYLPDPEGWEWRDLNISYFNYEEAIRPAQLLFDVFCKDASPSVIRNSANLLREPAFHGKLVWLEGLSKETWQVWREYIQEYAELSRGLHINERTRFVCTLEGAVSGMSPAPLIALSIRKWEGFVEKLDMMLYCSSLIKRRDLGPIKKALTVNICSNLAKWDPVTADYLCSLELIDLLYPIAFLNDLAGSFDFVERGVTWEEGTLNKVDDKLYAHSSYLAMMGKTKQLEKRIWEAQLTVLFPVLEEVRLKLVDYLDLHLSVPFHPLIGKPIEQKIDLEIGHIHFQICKSSNVDNKIRKYVGQLKELRNDLAHLSPIGKDKIYLIEALEEIMNMLNNEDEIIIEK